MTRPCAISTALAPDRRRTAGSRHVPGRSAGPAGDLPAAWVRASALSPRQHKRKIRCSAVMAGLAGARLPWRSRQRRGSPMPRPHRLDALFLGQATPDPVRLAGLLGESQAFRLHQAAGANLLGLRDLFQALSGGRNREEQFRINELARGDDPPVLPGCLPSAHPQLPGRAAAHVPTPSAGWNSAMSITPRTQPDCRGIGLSRFPQLAAGKDDGVFPPIDGGYCTADQKCAA
jgi:hypothetical protein